MGGILTYIAGINAPINPLPKMLPIPDEQYALYQIVFGPFIKLAGIFLFSGLIYLFTKYLLKLEITILPVTNFFMFIGFTLAVFAVIIDQVILWGNIQGDLRFWFSTIHPIVLVVQLIYITVFFHKYTELSLKSSALIITVSTVISYPLPGMFFR
ncbi:MAG: hypothetical protein ACFE9L_17985 [Candidatus Hodarchaeota archaeon]